MRSLRGERGAVTIFVILIIVPVFLLQAVLIEFVRSRLADQQLETAVRSALRSVGSAYHRQLQTYGLYGVTNDQAQMIFEEIVQKNMGHGFANTSYVSSKIELERSLADPDVFVEQILEEMKYRAPLEYTRQFVNKLQKTGISNALEDISDFSKKSVDMEKLANKREEAMERVWKLYHEWDNWISDSLPSLMQQVKQLDPEHSEQRRVDPFQLSSELTQLEDERDRLLELEERTEDEDEKLDNLERSIQEIKQALDDHRAWRERLGRLAERCRTIIYQTGVLNRELLRELAAAESYNQQLREHIDDWQEDLGSELINSMEIKDEAEFQIIREQNARFINRLEQIGSDFASLSARPAEPLAEKINAYVEDWSEWMRRVREDELKQAARTEEKKRQEKEAEKSFKDKINEVLSMLAGCDTEREEEERTIYEILKTKTKQLEQDTWDERSSYGEGRKAKDDALSIAQMIGQIGEEMTESIFVNEYALLSFNYRTLVDEESSSREPMSLTWPSKHPLQQQEVEYILYGFHSCALNYSAAYWEIFAVRLAIRTLESLMDPKNSWRALGSPLLAFLWALADGAVKAFQDVQKLKDGEELPISSKLAPSITWGYQDYLRLFLMLHGDKEKRIRRIQALVEVNTDTELAGHYTYWNSSAEGKLRPLFLGKYVYHPKVELSWGYY